MPHFNHKSYSRHTVDQIVYLILNIDDYSKFLPWCSESHITHKSPKTKVIRATLGASFVGLSQSYSSTIKVYKKKHAVKIITTSEDHPFESLHSIWNIEAFNHGCLITFSIDFKFRSKTMSAILDPLFINISKKMIKAFENRADEIYG